MKDVSVDNHVDGLGILLYFVTSMQEEIAVQKFYDFESGLPADFVTVDSANMDSWLYEHEGKLHLKGRAGLESSEEKSSLLRVLESTKAELTLGFEALEGNSGSAGLVFYYSPKHYCYLSVALSEDESKLSIRYAAHAEIVEFVKTEIVVENDELILRGQLADGKLQFSFGSWTDDVQEIGNEIPVPSEIDGTPLLVGIHCEEGATAILDFLECKFY